MMVNRYWVLALTCVLLEVNGHWQVKSTPTTGTQAIFIIFNDFDVSGWISEGLMKLEGDFLDDTIDLVVLMVLQSDEGFPIVIVFLSF